MAIGNCFLELARYVVLNPVRARMVRGPEDWPWSSYRAMIGAQAAPDWLQTRWILAAFGQKEELAVQGYIRFVAEGKGQQSPWEELKHQVFLGSDGFVESMRGKVPKSRGLREIPQARSRAKAKTIAHYDRNLVRSEGLQRRIRAAARSRAPRTSGRSA